MIARWLYSLPLLVLLLLSQNNKIEAGSERFRSFDFYGHSYGVFYHPVIDDISVTDLRTNVLLQQIERLRKNHMSILLQHLELAAKQFHLDPLGEVVMIREMSKQWMPHKSDNERTLFEYIMLRSRGYDVILTRTGSKLNLLGRLSFTPRKYVYVNYRGNRYVNLLFDKAKEGSQHEVIEDSYPVQRIIHYFSGQMPRIQAETEERNYTMIWEGDTLNIPAVLNRSRINYFYDLPLMHIGSAYVNNTLSDEVKESLYPELRKHLKGKTRADQLRFLLAFVQQIVPYGSDVDKYGIDYYYFPEQTLMAKTADCEDKAFLLSALSKDLLGLNSVALHFKLDQHLAIAFELPGFYGGQTFNYKGKHYVPCEPTANKAQLAHTAFDLSRIGGIIDLM